MSLNAARACALFVVGGALAVATEAAAGERTRACVDASDRAQTMTAEGHLLAARAALLTCVAESCPGPVRQLCEQWLRELESNLPSIVVRVSDAEGRDVPDVRVLLDGAVTASTLDGRAIAVDPGVHALRLEPRGAAPIEERIVVAVGEKNRVVMARSSGVTKEAGAKPVAPGALVEAQGSSVPTASYVLGGVGVVALGAFAYLAVAGETDYRACVRDGCTPSALDSLRTRRIGAWTALGVGVASLGAAAALALTSPRIQVALGLSPNAASAALRARF